MDEAKKLYVEAYETKDIDQIVGMLSINSFIEGATGNEFRLAMIVVMLRALKYAIGVLRAEGKNLPALTDAILWAIDKWSTGDLGWQELDELQWQAFAAWKVLDRQMTAGDKKPDKGLANVHHEVLPLLQTALMACIESDPDYQEAELKKPNPMFIAQSEMQRHGTNLMESLLTGHIALMLMDTMGGELKDWEEKIRDNAILAEPA